jgi:SSS family transporter
MHPLDIVAVCLYLSVMVGLGIRFGRHQSRREFLVAGRSMGWLPVGLSVMATLFSSNSFVFYPSAALGNGLRIGMSLVAFSLMTPIVIWVFIPVYARLKVETAYEYLELRFHVAVRTLASALFILLRIGWMASATYAAAGVIASVTGLSATVVIVVLGMVSIGYTMLGGLRAVMWTDVIQFFIFVTTIFLTLGLILHLTGSTPTAIFKHYFADRDGLLIDFTPSMTLPYGSWVILAGVFLEGLSAFGVDQVAVQRYISARNERTSQIGALINLIGMWTVIPGLLLIGVGLYAYFSQHPGELAPGDLGSLAATNGAAAINEVMAAQPRIADHGLPTFARLHFPPGLAGLFLAALLAALMSSIDSGVHSVTTALFVDFRDRLLPSLRPADQRGELQWIRLMVVLVGGIAILLACLVDPNSNVFDVGKKLTSAFGGPLLAIFLLALFSPRTSAVPVLVGVSLSTAATLYLMYTQDWFSVWYWPIGFGLSLVSCYAMGFVFPAPRNPLTYWKIMSRSADDQAAVARV